MPCERHEWLDGLSPQVMREMRTARGLSQGELAERIGTSRRTVNRAEGGLGAPGLRVQKAVQAMMRGGDPQPGAPDPDDEPAATPRASPLEDLMDEVPMLRAFALGLLASAARRVSTAADELARWAAKGGS